MSITKDEFYNKKDLTLNGDILRFLGEHKEEAFTLDEIAAHIEALDRIYNISKALTLFEQNGTIEGRGRRGETYYIML